MKLIKYSITIICLVFIQNLYAKNVDVYNTLQKKLHSKGTFNLSKACTRECIRKEKRCDEYSERGNRCLGGRMVCVESVDNCHTSTGHLNPVNVSGVYGDMEYGEPKSTSPVDKLIFKKASVKNCSSSNQTSNGAISLSGSASKSVSITKGVSATKGLSFNVSASFMGFGGGAGVNFSDTISNSDTHSSSDAESIVFSESYNRVVKPKTKLVTRFSVIQREMNIPFKTIVIADSDVTSNLHGHKKASDLLSKNDRTFNVEGFASADLFSSTNLEYFELPLSVDECKDDGKVLKSTTKQETVKFKRTLIERPMF